MRARDVMSRPVVSVDTRTTVRHATTLLTQRDFGAVPVVDDAGLVVGMFSESDALRAGQPGRDALVTTAMTSPVEVVCPAADITAVAERLLAGRLRSLPVVEDGLLVGIVARRDLLRTLVRADDVIEGGLRRLLDDYAGRRRHWAVEVHDGAVQVTGDFADDAERDIAAALARTVPGVTAVEIRATPPLSLGWDD